MMHVDTAAVAPTAYRKLNLGCGFDLREGFVNVDLNDFHSPDIVADISDLRDFPSGYYEEVVAQDVLEHMTREVSKVAFTEWARLLSPTGVLKVRIPSLIGLLTLIQTRSWDVEWHNHVVHLTFGTQAYNGDFHLTGFTPPILLDWAASAGVMLVSASLVDEWLYDLEFALMRSATDSEYLHQLYFEVLGRPADTEGLQSHLRALQDGASRDSVRETFVNSSEAKVSA
ncbi:DUF4214 domain-containing protein [Erythrobacter sp. SAORIC-644]|uniref:class I SAM-dependent methyltransferase n=1 Tax=Erythrobacter sp. SAORIC-644 TaxID=1869314 RepID=UPI0011AF0358|nr:DUF4214 domain-containing protein [Erythrobacter sp. SAORIC-644]